MCTIILSDNGSKKPGATLQLRELADRLSTESGYTVHPVSLQHADAIPADKINGIPARTFPEFMKNMLEEGETEFILLPLFFGESRAITSFIPGEVNSLEEKYGEFTFITADVIYPLPDGEPLLVDILKENINKTMTGNVEHHHVILVDHGSPVQKITAVRNDVAKGLKQVVPATTLIDEAVMERREGREYDFNGPLLEDKLTELAESGVTDICVAMMFFLAGRHAGTGGDIEEICANAMQQHSNLRVVITPLIAENPLLVTVLLNRLNNTLARLNR